MKVDWKKYLYYNENTGIFTWRVAIGNRSTGDRAGTYDPDGYVRIRLQGKSIAAHRLAYWWVHGELPINVIDHIDRVRDNNKILNLRDATISENALNTGVHPHSTTGVKNVTWNTNAAKYKVAVQVKGYRINVGSFTTIDAAIKARDLYNIHNT